MRNKIKNLLPLVQYMSDGELAEELVKILHSHYGERMMDLFIQIKMQDDKKASELRKELTSALQTTGGIVGLTTQYLLEDKTSRRAKGVARFYFETENLAFILPYCKSLYPGGNGAGDWWYQKAVEILRKNKALYLPGGKSHSWATMFGYYDYILLLIEKNNL